MTSASWDAQFIGAQRARLTVVHGNSGFCDLCSTRS